MATSKWSATCNNARHGRSTELVVPDCVVSGPCFKPERLERAVSTYLAANNATMPKAAKPEGDSEDELTGDLRPRSTKKSLVACVSFRRAEMLRGTRIAGVLRDFGQIFLNSEGSARTYELSSTVSKIDFFISHNWSTQRLDKFLVLATYFNARAAGVAMLVSAVLTVPLSVMGFLPMLEFVQGESVLRESVTAHLFGSVVGLLTLALAHEVRLLMGRKGPVAFLDKTCIHQTDAKLKREGIESLAAFLDNSKNMIIIYSETYLKKLWTVYELATMLLLHPERRIVVIPCIFPKVVMCGFFIWSLLLTTKRYLWLRSVTELLTSVTGLHNAALYFNAFVCIVVGMMLQKVLLDWERRRSRIKEVVQRFSIRDAMCFDEADRLVVQDNIVSFMHGLQLVAYSDSEEEEAFERRALDAFDDIVRTEVPPALSASLGRQSINYGQVVFMFMGQILQEVESLAPCILGILPVRVFLLQFVQDVAIGLAFMPLVVAAFMRNAVLEGQNLTCRRLRTLAGFTLICAGTYYTWFALNIVRRHALKDDTWLAIFALCICLLALLVAYVYRPVQNDKVGRKRLSQVLADPGSHALRASSRASTATKELSVG